MGFTRKARQHRLSTASREVWALQSLWPPRRQQKARRAAYNGPSEVGEVRRAWREAQDSKGFQKAVASELDGQTNLLAGAQGQALEAELVHEHVHAVNPVRVDARDEAVARAVTREMDDTCVACFGLPV